MPLLARPLQPRRLPNLAPRSPPVTPRDLLDFMKGYPGSRFRVRALSGVGVQNFGVQEGWESKGLVEGRRKEGEAREVRGDEGLDRVVLGVVR